MNEKVKFFIAGFICGLVIAAAGAGILVYRWRPASIGGLDSRYAEERGRAAETIGRLAAELERERELNRELREYNQQAGAIAGGLAETTERNVRNLQEAVGLIGEIRAKLKVLADFYADSGSSSNRSGDLDRNGSE